jgi:hypothetical protein
MVCLQTETAKFLLQYFAAMGEENKGEGNVHNQVREHVNVAA